ncbi:Gag protease polyprotein-like protein [Abeliophyllum distichum]|uniref:Gag protease polyprotein-like protein n=1 Tax=Abeliophyllum distichum TaxID=126358 RepID=A0ABD1PTA8_9LAMI
MVENDPIAVEKIVAAVVSAMHNMDRNFSIERATKLGANGFYSSYKDTKQDEFLKLVQGSSTVAEYQKKFIELSKYAQVLVSNEIDKCRRFEDRLREDIRSSVTAAGWNEFGKLVESALRVEKSMSDRQIDEEQLKSKASGSQTWTEISNYRPPQKDNRGFRPGVSTSGQFKPISRGSQGSRFS